MGIFKNQQQQQQEAAEMYISRGSAFEGNITSEGDVRIDGTVTGNIKAGGNISSGEGSVINGDLSGMDVIIGGELIGSITADGEFGAGEKAVIKGDVVCRSVGIDDGAEYEGTLKVAGRSRERRHTEEGEEE